MSVVGVPAPEAPAPAPPVVEAPAPEAPGVAPEGAAAPVQAQAQDNSVLEALIATYKGQPGLVGELVGGTTLGEVQASVERAKSVYATVKGELMQEQGLAVPGAHGGTPPVQVPATALGKISEGIKGK
ncbi:MAG: hypothetical protein IVW51_17625 [Thermaceae bacterium]|nr:hypothetical protein [Thermaceae bacterium]